MKLIRVITFLLFIIAILFLLSPTSSLQLHSRYSAPSQGIRKIVIKAASRKLLTTSGEHENVMTSTVHEDSREQHGDTSSGKSIMKNGKTKVEEKRLDEEQEEKALSKYLSMDYPKFRRRRPVHNKSLPLRP